MYGLISRGIFQRYLAHRINNQFQIFHNLPPDQNPLMTQRSCITVMNLQVFTGVPTSHFHQPKDFDKGCPPPTFINLQVMIRGTHLSLSVVPKGGPPLKMGGFASRIDQHTAQKGSPPLEFINIQPPK